MRVMLLLGGNLGDVEQTIERAMELIEREVGQIVARSKFYVSEAWGFERETPPFTNQAVEVESGLSPDELLTTTQCVERELGRVREAELRDKAISGERYASRPIDIDIIFYGDLVMESERLTLPHKELANREFVLRPIVEIAPEWRDARSGECCRELLRRLC
ncbi:MAG: 2-amino-4-hydroxy-6-hydroxymethyldihydropteridine diphosphokinase [Rikenellaceae bacterium]